MIYLDEDTRQYQIDLCSRSSDAEGVFCRFCQQVKKTENLCPMGLSWLTPLDGER
jgi:hypothetical protein